jgi:hypothetical protein
MIESVKGLEFGIIVKVSNIIGWMDGIDNFERWTLEVVIIRVVFVKFNELLLREDVNVFDEKMILFR